MKKLLLLATLSFTALAGAALAQANMAAPEMSAVESKLVSDFHYYDEECRGGIYAEEATQKACGARDYARHLLSFSGLCFEKRGDFSSNGIPHRCGDDSVTYPDLP